MLKYFTSFSLASTLAWAAFAQNNEMIKTRQESMKILGQSMKTLAPMAKDAMEFDQAAAIDAFAKIAVVGQDMKLLFPEDSKTGTGHDHDGVPSETEVSPAIWENRSAFDQLVNDFAENTTKASMTDIQSNEDVAAAMGMFASDCKSCHQDFRIKKE